MYPTNLFLPRCSDRWAHKHNRSGVTLRQSSVTEKTTFKPEKSQVIAISPDPVEKQKEFVEKQNLPVSAVSIPLTLSLVEPNGHDSSPS